MTEERAVLDVSALPAHGFDTRAPLWWGNLLLIAIETTTLVIAAAVYFYLSQNFNVWPPPRTETYSIMNPLPSLGIPTINLVLIILGCAPMIWVDRAARLANKRGVQIGLLICLLVGLATTVLRFYELPAVKIRWNSNAYGSAVWAVLLSHLIHLIVETLEVFILSVYIFNRRLDAKHRLDLTVLAVYWYWVAAVWIPLYLIVYIGPRFH